MNVLRNQIVSNQNRCHVNFWAWFYRWCSYLSHLIKLKKKPSYGFTCWKPRHSNMWDVGVYFYFWGQHCPYADYFEKWRFTQTLRWTILRFELWWRKVVQRSLIHLLRVWWIWWWWMKVFTPTNSLQSLWLYPCHLSWCFYKYIYRERKYQGIQNIQDSFARIYACVSKFQWCLHKCPYEMGDAICA